jgi:hypothetical protein
MAPQSVEELVQRFARIESRLSTAVRVQLPAALQSLRARSCSALRRVITEPRPAQEAAAAAAPPPSQQQEQEQQHHHHQQEQEPQEDAYVSPVQARLTAELQQKGFSGFRFVRAPPQYYHEPLEFRMGVLKAARWGSQHSRCSSLPRQPG